MIAWLLALALEGEQPPFTPLKFNQRELDAISARCGSPKHWLKLRQGSVRLRPSRNGDYRKVDCVLGKLRPEKIGTGFIGNEAPEPEKPE